MGRIPGCYVGVGRQTLNLQGIGSNPIPGAEKHRLPIYGVIPKRSGAMPKEVIESIGNLIISWDKNQHAQIKVDNGNPFIFVDKQGQPLVNEHNDAPLEFTGLAFTFDTRQDYNRAIRALRRARDSVLGKDA